MLKNFFYSVYRMLYLLIMYTGIRGLANRIIALKYGALPKKLVPFHKVTVNTEEFGVCRCFVYCRNRLPCGEMHFMLVLQMNKVPVCYFVYKFFCLTSHFGRGHIEAAFSFKDNKAIFFAFRNIGRSNAQRLCMKNIAKRLRVSDGDENYALALFFLNLLERSGIVVELEKPEKALRLAIDNRLLKARNIQKTYRAMDKNYKSLVKKLNRRSQRLL